MKTIWLEASAGAGKTTFLLQQQVQDPNIGAENILFITFSNAAALELTQRVNDAAVKIMTLHSLAYKIVLDKYHLKEIATTQLKKIAILKMLESEEFLSLVKWLIAQDVSFHWNFDQVSDVEMPVHEADTAPATSMIFNALASSTLIENVQLMQIKNVFFTKQGTLRKKIYMKSEHIEWALKRLALHEQYLQRYKKWVHRKLSALILLQEDKLKEESNVVYYDDLIKLATQIVSSSEHAEIVFKHFGNVKLFLIDEAQDLSHAQWDLIVAIVNEWRELGQTLIVAGDIKQLIYDFQGATPEGFIASKQAIKKLSSSFEEKHLNHTYRLPKSICAFLNSVAKRMTMQIGTHTTERELYGVVKKLSIEHVGQIVDYIKEHDVPPAEIMVLFKQKTERMEELARNFFSSGFLINSPFSSRHPIIKDFQHLIKWIVEDDTFSLAIVFNAIGVSDIVYEDLTRHEHMAFFQRLKDCTKNLEMLFVAWFSFAPMQRFLDSKLGASKDFYLDVLRRYAMFYRYDYIGAISDSKNFYNEHQSLFERGIFFNTIHSAKGKEANFVFLCETDFKSKFGNDTERLLYVALTRAKRELIIPILSDLACASSSVGASASPGADCKDTWAAKLLPCL